VSTCHGGGRGFSASDISGEFLGNFSPKKTESYP